MTTLIRLIEPRDIDACGRIGFEAHQHVAAKHGFAPEQPSIEFATGLIDAKVNDPNAWGAVAERDGEAVGSVFLNLFPPAPVAAIGPLTVVPSAQGGTGEQLMEAALAEARARHIDCVRLVQSPSHPRSLALYVRAGFTVREPLVLLQGKPLAIFNEDVRSATDDDLRPCNELCSRAYGFARSMELSGAVAQRTARVIERGGDIQGYITGVGFRGHGVAETNAGLATLVSEARTILGPGFFVPARNSDLLRYFLAAGLRIGWPAMLMTVGPYQDPSLPFVPSIAF